MNTLMCSRIAINGGELLILGVNPNPQLGLNPLSSALDLGLPIYV